MSILSPPDWYLIFWQIPYVRLSPVSYPPAWMPVLAHRCTTKYVEYGNGYNGPERRNILALDYWHGRWQHVGSGSYVGYFAIAPLSDWTRQWKIVDRKNYLVYIERPYQHKGIMFEGLFAAKSVYQADGDVDWLCLRHSRHGQDRYVSLPRNAVSHWMLFPTLSDVPSEHR